MDKLDRIIRECIERELMSETYKKMTEKEKSDARNDKISNDAENNLKDIFDNDVINVAAVARKLYPHHTKEGAQSQLRKKLKGIKNDAGNPYHLTKKEAQKLKAIKSAEL